MNTIQSKAGSPNFKEKTHQSPSNFRFFLKLEKTEELRKNFARSKIKLVCLSDFQHLLPVAVQMNYIKQEDIEVIKKWRSDPGNWGKTL
jgi:hypothetical protein